MRCQLRRAAASVTSRSIAAQERGERLAAARRGADERVLAGGDRAPALHLGGVGSGNERGEPGAHGRREPLERLMLSHVGTLPMACCRVVGLPGERRRPASSDPADGAGPGQAGDDGMRTTMEA